jgi:hypothetical protein
VCLANSAATNQWVVSSSLEVWKKIAQATGLYFREFWPQASLSASQIAR